FLNPDIVSFIHFPMLLTNFLCSLTLSLWERARSASPLALRAGSRFSRPSPVAPASIKLSRRPLPEGEGPLSNLLTPSMDRRYSCLQSPRFAGPRIPLTPRFVDIETPFLSKQQLQRELKLAHRIAG